MKAARMLALMVVALAGLFNRAANAQQAADTPDPQTIFAAAVKAVGGQEAIDKIRSLRGRMTIQIDSIEASMESLWTRSGGRKSIFEVPGGNMIMVTDGRIAWMELAVGYQLLSAEEADELRNQSCVFMNAVDPNLRSREISSTFAVAGKRSFGGAECWVLHATRPDGKQVNAFFDVQSGMPVGSEDISTVNDKEYRSWLVFSDWQEQSGVKFPRTITVETTNQPGVARALKVSAIELNVVDEAIFAVPDEVRKLASGAEVALSDLTPEQQKSATETLERMRTNGNVEMMKQMVNQIEPTIQTAPLAERASLQYLAQELRKEVAKRGG